MEHLINQLVTRVHGMPTGRHTVPPPPPAPPYLSGCAHRRCGSLWMLSPPGKGSEGWGKGGRHGPPRTTTTANPEGQAPCCTLLSSTQDDVCEQSLQHKFQTHPLTESIGGGADGWVRKITHESSQRSFLVPPCLRSLYPAFTTSLEVTLRATRGQT